MIAELKKRAFGGLTPDFELAVVDAALGEEEAAIAGLERAAAAFSPSILWIKVDYRLDGMRSHPRFAPLVTAVGLNPDNH